MIECLSNLNTPDFHRSFVQHLQYILLHFKRFPFIRDEILSGSTDQIIKEQLAVLNTVD